MSTQAALSRTVDEGERRARVHAARGARRRRRSDRARAHRAWQRRGRRVEDQHSRARPERARFCAAAREVSDAEGRVRQHDERERRHAADYLPAPNRVIITATKSSFERNESHFAQFFVDALTKDGADTDKDGRVSLLEAFRYAVVETKRVYDTDTRLQTEHAQLDDMGTKDGVADPDGRTGEGVLARRFFLDGGYRRAGGANDPQLAALYKDKFAARRSDR